MMRLTLRMAVTFFAASLLACSTGQDKGVEDELLDTAGESSATSAQEAAVDEFAADDLDLEEPGSETAQTPTESQEEFPEPQVDAAAEPTPAPAPVPEPEVAASTPTASLTEIQNIKYLANQSGGTIVIDAASPVTYSLRAKPETKQFVIEIQDAILPDRLKRPYILKEFDAAFAAINAYQNPGSTVARIVVQMKGENYGEPVLTQEGSSLVMVPSAPMSETLKQAEIRAEEEATPPSETEDTDSTSINVKEASADEKALGARSLDEFLSGTSKFYGRPISIEVTDTDMREVLNFIAVESGINMILADEVQGRITLKLRNIPWDQALVTIMRSKKLGYVRQGNVIRIATLSALQEENDQAKRILDSQKTLAPLRVKIIPVSYAQVDELKGQIVPFLTQGRGQITTDNRTSSLILTDTEDTLERVARLVRELDIPPAQVMIEGKIVEAQDTFTQNIGVNWQFSGAPVVLDQGGGRNGTDLSLTPRLSVNNVGVTTSAAQGVMSLDLQVGQFDLFGNISAALALAEQDSLVRILSSPRVVTMNKEKASISQTGQAISIAAIVSPQTGIVTRTAVRDQFELKLDVTPQITADGSVIMNVDVSRSFPGGIADTTTLARPLNTRTAKTKIMVRDGQTAVIGGIYSTDNTLGHSGVPWLRDIPVIGWLFKSRARSDIRNELLIFLTPKILNVKDQAVEG